MADSSNSGFRTRFAPSPTGLLHLGHAYSALLAYQTAKEKGGTFLLRIENTDTGRCRDEFEAAIYEDLAWLGCEWSTPALRQSEHFERYRQAISELTDQGLTYPCFCTRKEIAEEIQKSPSAPHGPEGPPYPGTCSKLGAIEREERLQSDAPHAIRLNLPEALRTLAESNVKGLSFKEEGRGPEGENGTIEAMPEELGDIVLARKDIPTSYHVSVVLDDALQEITHVIRGHDLFHATYIHLVLQALWGLKTPTYIHHALIRDDQGRRLAKRDKAQTIRALRLSGATPVEARERLQPRPS